MSSVQTTGFIPLGQPLQPLVFEPRPFIVMSCVSLVKKEHYGRAPLKQIQISLGHASIQTTERYLGLRQNLHEAPCDRLGIRGWEGCGKGRAGK